MVARTTRHRVGGVAILALGIGVTAAAQAASPTPISACPYTITVPGTYVVTRNLSATGTCIALAADNVALDLQGHIINGNGQGWGIVCSGCNGVVVANGTVTQFSGGVHLEGNYNTVAEITAQQNTDGISLIGDIGNVITDSVATKNHGTGIIVMNGLAATGIVATVMNSQSNGNGLHGIAGIGPRSNIILISNSTANNNVGNGIQASGSVINSTATNNGSMGIELDCPALAYGNKAVSNPGGNLVTSDNSCVLLDNMTTVGKSP